MSYEGKSLFTGAIIFSLLILRSFSHEENETAILSSLALNPVPQSVQTVNLTMCVFSQTANFCLNGSNPTLTPTLNWTPKPNKYLFAFCSYSQLSNRILCLRKYMFLAVALQRTLILSEKSYDWLQYDHTAIFDLDHVKMCLGEGHIISVKSYFLLEKDAQKIEVDFRCWSIDGCGCKAEFSKRLGADSVFASNKAKCEEVGISFNTTLANFMAEFDNVDSKVLSLGDVFYAKFLDEPNFFPTHDASFGLDGPCRAIQRPAKRLIVAAEDFVRKTVGFDFLSMHLRRGDFFGHCLFQKFPLCYPAIGQVGVCVTGVLRGLKNVSKVVIGTNGDPDEISFLQEALHSLMPHTRIPLLHVPNLEGIEGFVEVNNITTPTAKLTFVKLVLSMGQVFYGYITSTFSEDIMRIRFGLNRHSPNDGFCPYFNEHCPDFEIVE